MGKRMKLALVAVAFALSLGSPTAWATYVVTTWSDSSVHILDNSFNDLGSFPVGQSEPNGVGTDGTTIWVGTFIDATVRAFDFAGNLLYSWSDDFGNLQGLDEINGEIAIANNDEIQFRNALTGALIRTISGPNISGDIEGIDFDGTVIWAITDANLYGIDPLTGNTVSTIPNAAVDCDFNGTGIAAIGSNQLALVCPNGNWFVVSSLDGSVSSSGNNQLNMFGLDNVPAQVPEPGTLALLGLGLAGLAASRRKQ